MGSKRAKTGLARRIFQPLSILITSGLVLCCSISRSPHSTRATGAGSPQTISAQSNGKALGATFPEGISPLLAAALAREHDVARLFAWGGSETDGRIMWVDSAGHLLSVNFIKNGSGYEFNDLDPARTRRWRTILNQDELVPLAGYIGDNEFPVGADTLKIGDCEAKLVPVWIAEQRSFTDRRRSSTDLVRPAVRVVLRKGAEVTANSTFDFECLIPDRVLVDDVNGDGLNDYVFIGDASPVIYIWTLTDSCVLKSLRFKEASSHTGETSEFVEGRRIDIQKAKGPGYSIHVWSKAPLESEYTEEIYQWDKLLDAFVLLKSATK